LFYTGSEVSASDWFWLKWKYAILFIESPLQTSLLAQQIKDVNKKPSPTGILIAS